MQTRLAIPCAVGAFLAAASAFAATEAVKPVAAPLSDDESSLIVYPSTSTMDKVLFSRVDANGDGTLSLDELEAARAEGLLPT